MLTMNLDDDNLLNRKNIEVDVESCLQYISDRTVLITGAGGSIGSRLCYELTKYSPKQILLLGHGENSIYEIHQHLTGAYAYKSKYIPIIANIQDEKKITYIFKSYKPEVVFHVAAHKHVPLMEFYPEEAVKNNVLGTLIVSNAAARHGTEVFVSVSTDKAVNPTNVLGATKRVAEMIIESQNNKHTTKFCSVRFGNVLGSRGSVLPLFKKQISQGGPITVTSKEISRFFMSISEAAKLIIQAGALSSVGGIYFLDMGEPINIYELAKRLVSLYGLDLDVDIRIEIIGLRPGEKMHEEICGNFESSVPTSHPNIFFIKGTELPMYFDDMVKVLIEHAVNNEREEIFRILKKIVPEFEDRKHFLDEVNLHGAV